MEKIGEKMYILALTHALGHPYFDTLIIDKCSVEKISFKGHIKQYMLKFVYVVQSETFFKYCLYAITINCLFERYVNF
jgi:hypothetical protein